MQADRHVAMQSGSALAVSIERGVSGFGPRARNPLSLGGIVCNDRRVAVKGWIK